MTDNVNRPAANVPMLEEHQLLMKQLAEFREWVGEVQELGHPHFREMGTRMQTLRDLLKDHFAKEEAGGYLALDDDAGERSERGAELRAQHTDLLQSFDAMIVRLMESPPEYSSWQEAVGEFEGILTRLRKHEGEEVALFQELATEANNT
jgi:hypothetical protein